MSADNWPYWLPRGMNEFKPLTQAQINYVKPLFKLPSDTVDGVYLNDKGISGSAIAIREFMKRFRYFD